ncbi:MAG: hemolysin III family protein [Flavobacteriaceae bacterium]|jgi:hemolysin III|nr:hemolysin III family protein [Flavobacteriaceae bacterium]
MKSKESINNYAPLEEKWNVYTHALGLLLSVIGLILLIVKAINEGSLLRLISFSIFGISLVILYKASTLFHNSKNPKRRRELNIVDHASIYLLIAGSYTPFALMTLKGSLGWIIFGIVWTIAIIGIVLKLFYTGSFEKASTIAYVLMGWIIMIVIKPIINNISIEGFYWLLAGGISYTIGAVLYSIQRIKYNHAIFHVFVLGGSICHFITIYYYV